MPRVDQHRKIISVTYQIKRMKGKDPHILIPVDAEENHHGL